MLLLEELDEGECLLIIIVDHNALNLSECTEMLLQVMFKVLIGLLVLNVPDVERRSLVAVVVVLLLDRISYHKLNAHYFDILNLWLAASSMHFDADSLDSNCTYAIPF